MATPAWLAATTGQPPEAAQVNQLLGTHVSSLVYTGAVVQSSQTTAGTGATTSNGLWIAQSFTTGSSQTAIGRIDIDLQAPPVTGNQLAPVVIGIYANSAGAPTGSALVSTTVPVEYVISFGVFTPVPMPVTGLTASTTYWLVTQPVGNVTNNYPWEKSNQTSGASTSTNGTAWTAQTYGLLYKVYDTTTAGSVALTWEDSGARFSYATWNTNGTIASLKEYTAGQTTTGYAYSSRSWSYTSGLIASIA